MKLEIDFESKTIKLLCNINLNELFDTCKNMGFNLAEWNIIQDYKVETSPACSLAPDPYYYQHDPLFMVTC